MNIDDALIILHFALLGPPVLYVLLRVVPHELLANR